MHEPNTIKVAVTAAGGRIAAAQALGVSVWSLTYWQRTGSIPAEKVRPLAALTKGLVSPEELLAFCERLSEQKAAA